MWTKINTWIANSYTRIADGSSNGSPRKLSPISRVRYLNSKRDTFALEIEKPWKKIKLSYKVPIFYNCKIRAYKHINTYVWAYLIIENAPWIVFSFVFLIFLLYSSSQSSGLDIQIGSIWALFCLPKFINCITYCPSIVYFFITYFPSIVLFSFSCSIILLPSLIAFF